MIMKFLNGSMLDGLPAMPHKSGGGGSTKVSNEPPKYAKPYLEQIAKAAQSAYGKARNQANNVPTDLIADPTQAQTDAINMQKNIGYGLTNMGQAAGQIADQQINKVLSGAYTAPANDQFTPTNLATDAAINAAIDPVKRNLNENILPSLASKAIQDGAYGGSRYFTDMGKQVNDNFTREAANIAATMQYNEGVRQEGQKFDSWATNKALLPELLKLEQTAALTAPELQNTSVTQSLLPSQILNQAGTQEQINAQDRLDELYQLWELNTKAPFVGLDQYMSLISGATPGGTSTTTSGKGGGNFMSGALGGATTGFGAAQALSLSNPWTAGLVIGGGLLGGLFG